MTIKTLVCDSCGREINALIEPYEHTEDQDLCGDCLEEKKNKDTEIKSFTVIWEGLLTGFQKVKAKDTTEAKNKAEESMNITRNYDEPYWRIVNVFDSDAYKKLYHK